MVAVNERTEEEGAGHGRNEMRKRIKEPAREKKRKRKKKLEWKSRRRRPRSDDNKCLDGINFQETTARKTQVSDQVTK